MTNKVFIVSAHTPYEGDLILAIYDNEEAAKSAMLRYRTGPKADRFYHESVDVEEWEVFAR